MGSSTRIPENAALHHPYVRPLHRARADNLLKCQIDHLNDRETTMNAFATTGLGFLLAVLWFDLMFDEQTRRHDEEVLPPEVLASISAYYRRVTTDASPMNRLVALMMLVVLGSILAEIFADEISGIWTWGSLALAIFGFAVTRMRTLPNAIRLGQASDPPEMQSHLARSVFRDHAFGFARTLLMLAVQLATQ